MRWWKPINTSTQTLEPEIRLRSAEDEAFISRLAKKILDSGLVTPAIFFLELSKPLALLGSHALIFFGPIINAFIRTDGYYRAAELFEEPQNVEFLIREIERLDQVAKQNKEEKPQ